MIQIQDIILRHVRDPIAKRNIARELIALAQGQSPLSAIGEPHPDDSADTIEVEAEFVDDNK